MCIRDSLEAVPGAEIKELANGATEVVWTGLDKADGDGNAYEFVVKEVNADGSDFVPENYTKTEEGLKVINTYVIPANAAAKAEKKWVGGPKDHPDIWFKLFRNVEGGMVEAVPGAEIKRLANGTTVVEWNGLEATDINGNVYIFSVKEVDSNGNPMVLDKYVKKEEGLLVTNTFVEAPKPDPTKPVKPKLPKTGSEAAFALYSGITPVSYTHLDVYKRQTPYFL